MCTLQLQCLGYKFRPSHILSTSDSDQLLDLLCPGLFWMVHMALTPSPESPLELDEQPENSQFLHPGIQPVFSVDDPDDCIFSEWVWTFFLVLFSNNTIKSKRYLCCIIYCKLRYMGRCTCAGCEHCYFMDWKVAHWVKPKREEQSSDNQTHIKR